MKIGLLGFEFRSANKGCEALSYSFCEFLNSSFKDEKVEVVLFGETLGILPKIFPNIDFKLVVPKLKDLKFDFIKNIIRCDCICDITMGDSFSDIYSKDYCLGLIRKKRIVEIFGKKYISLPQTYGPFSDDLVRKKAIEVIKKADFVISRDQKSIDYLREIGVKREIYKEIDLAFMLPYDADSYNIDKEKVNIGINVSGLLWNGGFHTGNQFGLKIDYRKYIYKLIESLASAEKFRIHLIPHVIDLSENPYDDDYHVLVELHEKYPDTVLAPAFETPVEAKSYIANMDCFVGSRMHATIGALSANVAVIPVSYSRKFEGLYDTLGYNYLVNGREETTDDAVNKTTEWIQNYPELRDVVGKIKQHINSDCDKLTIALLKIIQRKG